MAGKDQAIGGLILIVCVVVGFLYVITLFYPQWLGVFGISGITWVGDAQFWVVAIPVLIAFVGIMAIGAWIGWTMATTPPPKPIEELTSEMEEKKEEPPPAPQEEPVEEKVEEKKPERKRKEEK
jgi:predicted DNA-binding transcriptional regulator